MNALEIIRTFYPDETPLLRLLLEHSMAVRNKALAILHGNRDRFPEADETLVAEGALLHDIGICRCHAPGILCTGEAPYLAHGLIGGNMLREWGEKTGNDFEPFARICERHTGSGITAQEIREHALPLPPRDLLPETTEEKLICLADKFFSKSGDRKEKSLTEIRRGMAKFGPASAARFEALLTLFHL